MKQFPFPLRFSLPAVILIFGSLVGLFSFQSEVSQSYLRVEEESSRQARFFGNQTSGMLEYLYRNQDLVEADLFLSQLGSDSNLQLALVYDENNRVILATRYKLRNLALRDTTAANGLPAIKKIRQTISGQVILSEDRQSIRAIYPVLLSTAPGELISSRVGILLLEYDLSAKKKRAYTDALLRSLRASVVLALLCTMIWLFFDKTLTLQVVRLVEATNRLAKGEFGIRAGLQGSDELTQISVAFDQMANQIQLHQQQLAELATQRKELLNILGSQLRNSFELDIVLSTAVSETRSFLDVERCNFLWCYFDCPSPSFDLSYEARLPDLPSVLGKYPIENPIDLYAHALLNFKTVRIDDLTSDTFLDASLRSRLLVQGYVSYVCCPIQIRSGKLGVLTCAHCHTIHSWRDDEVEFLQSVANQLAIAIEQNFTSKPMLLLPLPRLRLNNSGKLSKNCNKLKHYCGRLLIQLPTAFS